MRAWVSDIVEVPPERRTKRDWGRLGVHHAQATLARVIHEMPGKQRQPYLLGLTAGALYECQRLTGSPLAWYYCSMHAIYDLALAVEESERGWLGPRVVA